MDSFVNVPEQIKDIEIYAWIGEDERGSGVIGIKQALLPAGYIPLAAVDEEKMNRGILLMAMSVQADTYGHKIYLCRFRFDGVVWATAEGRPPV